MTVAPATDGALLSSQSTSQKLFYQITKTVHKCNTLTCKVVAFGSYNNINAGEFSKEIANKVAKQMLYFLKKKCSWG